MPRIILAALLGYALIGVLVFGTNRLFPMLLPGFDSMKTPPASYFAISMATDTVHTLIGGWLCARISRGDMQATLALIVAGEIMGIASTIFLWGKVPHFYSFYLLIMYPAAVWYAARPGKSKLAEA
jgi:hypothetical protein